MLKRLGQFFLDIIQVVVFAIATFLLIYLLIFQPHKIKGASMLPNHVDGEYLLTDKVTYRLKEPERGDIVVFEAPTGNGDEYIKRIVALPGEKVSVKEGYIFINGKKLSEPYIEDDIKTLEGAFLIKVGQATVPEDEYFVVGDNRPHSSDSRAWGFVSKEKITGRAWVIYWPLNKMGLIQEVEYNF